MTRVDVDGDRKVDTVSITPGRGSSTHVVRVVTARKTAAQTTLKTPWLMGQKAWFGAAAVDGAPGAELVVRTGFGAHTSLFNVLSWRSGKLVAQKDPSTRSTQWSTDGAASISQGYRTWTKGGATMLTTSTYLREDTGRRDHFVGSVDTFRWQRGRWAPVTSRQIRLPESSPALSSAYGWHIRGLPVG